MSLNMSIFYNTSALTDVGTPEGLIVAVDGFTGGVFSLLLLVTIFTISFLGMKGYLASKAALGAFTVTTLFSLLLMGVGVIPVHVPVVLIVATISTLFWVRG